MVTLTVRGKQAAKTGFTLIELLVVIAIIAILAAILFPVFAQARRAARTTATMSNVRQLLLGTAMYTQDYDETIIPYEVDLGGSVPASGNRWMAWPILIQPYLKNTGICFDPSRPVPFVQIDTTNNNWGWSTTLAINRYGFATRKWDGEKRTLASFPSPTTRLAFIVSRDPWGASSDNPENNWLSMHWIDGQRSACPNRSNIDEMANYDWQYNGEYKAAKAYHGNMYVVAYADGHAGKVNADRMSAPDTSSYYGNCENRYFTDTPAAADAEASTRMMEFWGKWWDSNY